MLNSIHNIAMYKNYNNDTSIKGLYLLTSCCEKSISIQVVAFHRKQAKLTVFLNKFFHINNKVMSHSLVICWLPSHNDYG